MNSSAIRNKLLIGSVAISLAFCHAARGQNGKETDPGAALQAMLTAACRQDETAFGNYLTRANAAAYAKLPVEERLTVLKRISLLEQPGRALFSTDAQKRRVLACEGQAASTEFHFRDERTEENLAFIAVETGAQSTQFGMVREGGGWRLLSLGLLVFDIPALEQQWAEQDLAAREDAVVKTLNALADAVAQYQRAFAQLPDSLAQLGPAPPEGASPDAADLVAGDLAKGSREGYQYRYRVLPSGENGEMHFALEAAPEQYGKTGRRSFFLDGEGKIHAADKQGKSATAADPLLNPAEQPSIPAAQATRGTA
jgi:hypothetical protein